MFYGSYSWHILVVWIVRRLAKMFLAINNKHFFVFGKFLDFFVIWSLVIKWSFLQNLIRQLKEKVPLFDNIFS